MKRFVVDEWLWADLGGENGQMAQRQSFLFLEKIFELCDQLITVEDSPFIKKFYNLCKEASLGDPKQKIVKVFKNQFLLNAQKLKLIKKQDLQELPPKFVPMVKEDDHYLIQAYLSSQADLIVTTDNPLIEVLNNQSSVNCQDRNSFLSDYLT